MDYPLQVRSSLVGGWQRIRWMKRSMERGFRLLSPSMDLRIGWYTRLGRQRIYLMTGEWARSSSVYQMKQVLIAVMWAAFRNILPDTEYYITRQIIPPINRVLKLVGVDAAVWYAQMPRRHLVYDRFRIKDGKTKLGKTLDATWRTAHCLVCGLRCGKDQGEIGSGKGMRLS